MNASYIDTIRAEIEQAESLRAAVQKVRAAMLAPDDAPGSLTERERRANAERRRLLDGIVTGIEAQVALLPGPMAQFTDATADRDRLIGIDATLEQRMAALPDYRTITDPREAKAVWTAENDLAASRRGIRVGVEFFNGVPALPSALRAATTVTCDHCGHSTCDWPGSLAELEQTIATAEKRIDETRWRLGIIVKAASELLEPSLATK